MGVLECITTADLASIRHSRVYSSPERLTAAAEAILDFVIPGSKRQHSSTSSTHKSWLLRAKPGKYVATGSPRLASVFHVRSLTSNRLRYGASLGASVPTHPKNPFQTVGRLLNAILWILPKARFSEKIVLYSNSTIPRNLYRSRAGLCHRVQRCLGEYNVRVRSERLEMLDLGIENG